ncbi:MAG: hypothetical protein ABIH92_04995 [Nanoarchaeota archaeon]
MKKEGIIFLLSFGFVGLFLFLISSVYADSITGEAITGETITGETITGQATEGDVNVSISVVGLINITIHHPEDTIYKFGVAEDIVLDLNVSASNDSVPDAWWFTLIDRESDPDVTLNDSVIFTPNTTIYPNRGLHELIVYANNSIGIVSYKIVTFYIDVNNTAPIIENLSSEILVCENGALSEAFNVTDAEAGDIEVGISPLDPFYVSPTSYSGYVTRQISLYSVVLEKDDVGLHEETISVSDDDDASDVKMTNITVIEVNNAPIVENVLVRTIWAYGENRTYYENVNVDDEEGGNQSSGNVTFNLTFLDGVDPFFSVNWAGAMGFVANESLLGPSNSSVVYNLSLCVTDMALENPHQNITDVCGEDGSNNTVCQNFSFTITAENRAPYIVSYFYTDTNISANATDTLSFSVVKTDPDGTIPDAYWYVDGSREQYDTGSSEDTFLYSFGCGGASGSHTVSVEITDGLIGCYNASECNDSVQWNVDVEYEACSPGGDPGGGGPGGGSSGGVSCREKWACNDWGLCNNAKDSLGEGILGGEDYRVVGEGCLENGWGVDVCGYQTRGCFDVNYCNRTYTKPSGLQSCYFTESPDCFDGIKNCHDGACEFLIDCGGPCSPCPTCSDGVQNQREEGIDCGGPCPVECVLELPVPRTTKNIYPYIFIGVILLLVVVVKIYQMKKLRKKLVT